MSDGKSVSVLWLLGLILLALLWVARSLSEAVLLLYRLNANVGEWRTQFSNTFQYVEDDADLGSMWGNEQEAH